MYRVVTCLVVLLLSWPGLAAEKDSTYCDDPAVWADWHETAAQHAGDLDFQTLHALWMGLCMKVSQGSLTSDEAAQLFEKARETLIQHRRDNKDGQQSPTF